MCEAGNRSQRPAAEGAGLSRSRGWSIDDLHSLNTDGSHMHGPTAPTAGLRRPWSTAPRPSTAMQEDEKRAVVADLVMQLPQAKNAVEVFSLFANRIQCIFPGLQHARCAGGRGVRSGAALLALPGALGLTASRGGGAGAALPAGVPDASCSPLTQGTLHVHLQHPAPAQGEAAAGQRRRRRHQLSGSTHHRGWQRRWRWRPPLRQAQGRQAVSQRHQQQLRRTVRSRGLCWARGASRCSCRVRQGGGGGRRGGRRPGP